MTSVESATRTEIIDTLRATVDGEVVAPGDPGYDQARSAWNGLTDQCPAVIVRCTGTADVVEAVAVARRHRLTMSIRGMPLERAALRRPDVQRRLRRCATAAGPHAPSGAGADLRIVIEVMGTPHPRAKDCPGCPTPRRSSP